MNAGTRARVADASDHDPLRIWFYSELFWPEETSTGYFLTRIAEDVATVHEVHAVCSQPTYSARGVVAPRREVRNGVRIRRVRSTTLNKDVLPYRLVNLLTFGVAAFLHALIHFRRGDIAVAVTNPPIVPYLIRAAAAIRGARFVLLIHDVYPEVLVATGYARGDALSVRLLHAVSGWLYRSAERVVVLGRDMAEMVGRKLPTHARQPVIVPHWGDTERIVHSVEAGLGVRRELGLPSSFVVEYMGNMGRTHDMPTLVEAAVRVQDDPVFFLFLGWGAQRQWLENEVHARGLRNVMVQGPCSGDEINGYLNAADAALISFRAGMAGVSVPSRMYNMMAAGKAIVAVADKHSEVARVIREERAGWVVEPGSVDELAELLRSLPHRAADVADAGARARAAAVRHYSRDSSRASWLNLFQGMRTDGGRVAV